MKPTSRNQNLFLCKCRVFVSLSVICHHTVAVSHVVGKLLEYCMEVKKKLTAFQAKRKIALPKLTAGMESNLPLSHRGMKANEIGKATLRRKSQGRKQAQAKSPAISKVSSASSSRTTLPSSLGFGVISSSYLTPNGESSLSSHITLLPANLASIDTSFNLSNQQRQQQPPRQNQPSDQQQEAPQTQQRGQQQPYQVDSRCTSQTSCSPIVNQTTQSVTYSQGPINFYDDQTLLTGTFHSFTQPQSLQQPQPHFLHGLLDSVYTTPRLLNPMSGYSPTSSTTTSLSSQVLQPSHWHSGMSPYPYELIEFPGGGISKCYGCNQEFADRYKASPNNHIVRHRDRRIRGKDEQSNIVYNGNFTCSYYHPNRRHVEMKNLIFSGDVFVSNALYLKLGTAKVATLSAASGLRILKIQDPPTPLSSRSIGH